MLGRRLDEFGRSWPEVGQLEQCLLQIQINYDPTLISEGSSTCLHLNGKHIMCSMNPMQRCLHPLLILHLDLHLDLHLGLHLDLHLDLHLGLHLDQHLGLHLNQHLGLHLNLHLGLHPNLHLQLHLESR